MKKMIAAVAITLLGAGTVLAAEDVMTFTAKNGDVKFDHKMHKEAVKDCKSCHGAKIGKIEDFGKDWAHKNCKGCHVEKKAGPTKCGECHVK